MTSLRQALHDYLAIRRRLGFELKDDGRLLEQFVCFLEQAGAARVTTELALIWARQPIGAHPSRWRERLGIVRGFARYLATLDPGSDVPATDLLPAHRPRVTPYLYSPAEIAALMGAARGLASPLRAATYETLIGLLACSGLRPGEALALDRGDVDLAEGTLHVRAGKQRRQREVPLHESAVRALSEYARLRDRRSPRPATPAFFVSTQGKRLSRRWFNRTYSELIERAGLEGRGERCRPRPHDLRHSFAVRTLLDWHRAGVDVDRKMPLLSTYLGHVKPASTYWYLQAAPELLQLVSQRLERVPEVLP